MHRISGEMCKHLKASTLSVKIFIETGAFSDFSYNAYAELCKCIDIPEISLRQKHAANNLLQMSTVATFFSAVTATTLQFSFDKPHSVLTNAVNALWFTSLVLSIGSAVNSLLGLAWKQTE
jgi:WD repeat-containing protein 26